MLTIVLALGSFAFPCWSLLLLVVPVLMVATQVGAIEPVAEIGSVAINPQDMIVGIVLIRTAAYAVVSGRFIRIPTAFSVFVGVLVLSTVMASSSGAFLEQCTALTRFLAQASAVVLLPYSLRSARQITATCRAWRVLGYLVAASVYVDMVLFSLGLPVGEVQVTADGVRYFGPLGDQVGFLLPLFIYRDLLGRHLAGAAFCLVALLMTGTRGALIALSVGLAVFAWPYRRLASVRRNALIGTSFISIMACALWFDPGGMITRFVNPQIFGTGLRGRTASIDTAFHVFLDHPIFGVGFGGFKFNLSHYYSVENVYGTFNQLLQVATDAGVIGAAAFVWMILSLMRLIGEGYSRETGDSQELLHAGYIWLAGLAIGNQSTAWLLPGSMIATVLWLLVGTACVAGRYSMVELEADAEGAQALHANSRNVPVRLGTVHAATTHVESGSRFSTAHDSPAC